MRWNRRVKRVVVLGAVLVTAVACAPAAPSPRGAAPAVTASGDRVPAAPTPATTADDSGVAGLGPAAGPAGTPPTRRDAALGSSSAAVRYGWTKLIARDDFSGTSLHSSWGAYDSVGNSGDGRRSPGQISVRDGILRITGTPDGTTGGMAWDYPRRYGRWEIRARFPAGCGCYHPVLILWPADDPWPAGGEIDYAEVFDGPRARLHFFLHYGEDNRQLAGSTAVDMTRWHNFAVEWTAGHISGYVDGDRFFHTTYRDAFPPGRMEQTIQLDWFPDGSGGGATLEVDWATIYGL